MNGDRPTPPGDAERDAWLRAALRHAPDAATGAPPALGEAILREATAKARPAGAAPRPARIAWWSVAWAWLARPSVGAAFAGIVMATTVGLLWHDTPLPEAPRPETRVAAPPPASPAPPPPAAPAAAQDAAVARVPEATAQAPVAKPAAPPARREAAPTARAPAALAKRRAPTPKAEPQVAGGDESMSVPAPPAPPVVSADAGTAPAAAGAAPAPRIEQRLAAAAPAFSLADVRAALAADPSAWTWQRAGGPARPVDDALSAWLATLDAAAGPRWQRGGAGPQAASSSGEVVLLHRGRIAHRLHLDDDRVRWDTLAATGATQRWQAPLAPADARALQSRLDEATR